MMTSSGSLAASLPDNAALILAAVLLAAFSGMVIQSLALPRSKTSGRGEPAHSGAAPQRGSAGKSRHVILQLSLYSFLTAFIFLVLGKIWFSCAVAALLILVLVVINNAKYRSLREPLVFSDYDYFTDSFRFPRLYFPFLGIPGNLGLIMAAIIAITGWSLEEFSGNHWSLSGDLPVIAVILLFSGAGLWFCGRNLPERLALHPATDLINHGFIPMLYGYMLLYLKNPPGVSPFGEPGAGSGLPAGRPEEEPEESKQQKETKQKESKPQKESNQNAPENNKCREKGGYLWSDPLEKPDLIAIQSESFFDLRVLCSGGESQVMAASGKIPGQPQIGSPGLPGIRSDILGVFDGISREACYSGLLEVPAFGANTIRTEFSFLTGIPPEEMAGHQFSPYQISSRFWETASLTSFLKKRGYRTVCIHPFYAGFYHRDIIFRKWGFDEFQDIRSFAGISPDPDNSGPYIADRDLLDRVLSRYQDLKKESPDPVFIFVITMENHGPLNLERITPEKVASYFDVQAEAQAGQDHSCRALTELAIYLRHLENEDALLERLTGFLNNEEQRAVLTFYGDHVPILTETYKVCGDPAGLVPYFVWQNRSLRESLKSSGKDNPAGMCRVSDLGLRTLSAMGFSRESRQ
ncbi:LTA synthase family protein [Succinimonas sp.]|uniref:LTA synthase family protein n=1 Tax=Succinimonas sp. TaxID=1936151 RepID=UPI00386D0946